MIDIINKLANNPPKKDEYRVEEILESRSKPGNLPKSNKSDGSSRDAAADALRKYFGNR